MGTDGLVVLDCFNNGLRKLACREGDGAAELVSLQASVEDVIENAGAVDYFIGDVAAAALLEEGEVGGCGQAVAGNEDADGLGFGFRNYLPGAVFEVGAGDFLYGLLEKRLQCIEFYAFFISVELCVQLVAGSGCFNGLLGEVCGAEA